MPEYPSRKFEHNGSNAWVSCYPLPGDQEWLLMYIMEIGKAPDVLRLKRIEYPTSELALARGVEVFWTSMPGRQSLDRVDST